MWKPPKKAHYSLCLALEVVVVCLLPELRLEPLERPVLGEQLVPQPRDLVVRLPAHLHQRRLQRVDALRQSELCGREREKFNLQIFKQYYSIESFQ